MPDCCFSNRMLAYLKPAVLGLLLMASPFLIKASQLMAAIGQKDSVSYSKAIAPIFQERCVACHNHTARQGGLNMESFESLMNGGKSGAVILAGKSQESRIVKMIEGTLKPRMPIGDPLMQQEIETIKAWIDAGAPGPEAASGADRRSGGEPESKTNAPPVGISVLIPEIKPTTAFSAAISSLAYTPDNSFLAVGRYQLVEFLTKGSPPRKLAGHINQVRALAFSPDGKLLAAAGGNPAQFGEIKIWDVAGQKEWRTIRGHRDNIFAIVFSPDGTKLATCSYDRMIKLWDVTTGKELMNLKDHTDAVFQIAFSPDGKRLASASADRTVKIWDVATGKRLYTLSDALDAVNTVSFHPSGKLLAGAGADRIIRIWELGETEGRQIKSLIAHEDAINQIAFSPNGRVLVSTAADRQLKFWDPNELVEIHTAEVQPDWVFALAFSPDGKRLAVGRHDGSVAVYDPMTGKRKSL
ncbi:MAG: c-type cytochrome domain-containing protein [Blastocatellia bacterium]